MWETLSAPGHSINATETRAFGPEAARLGSSGHPRGAKPVAHFLVDIGVSTCTGRARGSLHGSVSPSRYKNRTRSRRRPHGGRLRCWAFRVFRVLTPLASQSNSAASFPILGLILGTATTTSLGL